jgi:hypothetical protein
MIAQPFPVLGFRQNRATARCSVPYFFVDMTKILDLDGSVAGPGNATAHTAGNLLQ